MKGEIGMNKEPEIQVEELLLWSDINIHKILEEVCKEYGVTEYALAELVNWQRERQQVTKSRNRNATFDEVFENYWNS